MATADESSARRMILLLRLLAEPPLEAHVPEALKPELAALVASFQKLPRQEQEAVRRSLVGVLRPEEPQASVDDKAAVEQRQKASVERVVALARRLHGDKWRTAAEVWLGRLVKAQKVTQDGAQQILAGED